MTIYAAGRLAENLQQIREIPGALPDDDRLTSDIRSFFSRGVGKWEAAISSYLWLEIQVGR